MVPSSAKLRLSIHMPPRPGTKRLSVRGLEKGVSKYVCILMTKIHIAKCYGTEQVAYVDYFFVIQMVGD